jgi:hypothetical protein
MPSQDDEEGVPVHYPDWLWQTRQQHVGAFYTANGDIFRFMNARGPHALLVTNPDPDWQRTLRFLQESPHALPVAGRTIRSIHGHENCCWGYPAHDYDYPVSCEALNHGENSRSKSGSWTKRVNARLKPWGYRVEAVPSSLAARKQGYYDYSESCRKNRTPYVFVRISSLSILLATSMDDDAAPPVLSQLMERGDDPSNPVLLARFFKAEEGEEHEEELLRESSDDMSDTDKEVEENEISETGETSISHNDDELIFDTGTYEMGLVTEEVPGHALILDNSTSCSDEECLPEEDVSDTRAGGTAVTKSAKAEIETVKRPEMMNQGEETDAETTTDATSSSSSELDPVAPIQVLNEC